VSVGLFAQTSLTYEKNALVKGDSFAFLEIQAPDPGNAGSNQIWDFSMIQYTGKNPVSTLQDVPLQKIAGVDASNLSLNENGYDYFMNSSVNKLEELGYVNAENKLTLVYSDPVVKMKYPFSYGDQFADHFIGIAYYNETSKIDFFGDSRVTADAYGTLIMPDRIIDNALRVKTVKTGLQINMCGFTDVNIVKYSWYAQGYRYPVISISTVENKYNGGATEITKSAFTNTQQLIEKNAIASSGTPAKQIEKKDVTVILSPNPFNDKLIFDYSLPTQMPVSIELYDMSGKHSGWLVKNQPQSGGLHTGELNANTYGLKPGVYFIRFSFDKQVMIRKVVKM
jgi:hypothetical protein